MPGMSLFVFAVAPSGLICPLGSQLGMAGRGGCGQWCAWRSRRISWRNTRNWIKVHRTRSMRRSLSSPGKPATNRTSRRREHSRDHRIRTIRIDSVWRGVVLAPDTGDTYCLITVLPHEKANAFAASRRFSVNQALGVLEVRDEDAIRQLEPSLQAGLGARRLFADVSDADLARLGIDAQTLPTVRLLTSEADLEALQNGAAGCPVRRAARAGVRDDRGRSLGRGRPAGPRRCTARAGGSR